MQKRVLLFGVFFSTVALFAQTGGTGVFRILDIPMHSRALAWCGYLVTQPNADVLQSVNNPALLESGHSGKFGLSVGSVLPTVRTANANFAWQGKNKRRFLNSDGITQRYMWGAYAQHLDYGTMDAFDAGGNAQGEVFANETNLGAMVSVAIADRWRLGSQIGMVYSILGPYVSNGVYANLGCNYIGRDSVISFGFVMKNLGTQVIAYRNTSREPLPFNAQMAVALSPKHMPLKFHLTAHSLQRWDLTYDQYIDNGGQIDLNGKPLVPKEVGFGGKLVRHIAIGTELALGQNLGILFGYNHQRRMEMATSERRGTSGFGFGLKFRMAKVDITYSSASYFPSQNSNQFSLIVDPARFAKKRTVPSTAFLGTPQF